MSDRYIVTADPSGARSVIAEFEDIGEAGDWYGTWAIRIAKQGGSVTLYHATEMGVQARLDARVIQKVST